jgi:hypothetical protein
MSWWGCGRKGSYKLSRNCVGLGAEGLDLRSLHWRLYSDLQILYPALENKHTHHSTVKSQTTLPPTGFKDSDSEGIKITQKSN